jgi:hypothetical protein
MSLTLTNASKTTFTNASTSASGTTVTRDAPSVTSTDPERLPHAMPAFIGTEEAYFWSFAWQEGIRESMAARASGDSRVFDSDDPNDVVRWLLTDDD